MRKSPELRRIAWIPRSGLRQNSRAACFPGAPLFVLTVIGVASFCHIGFAQSNLVLRSLEIPKSEIKQFDKRAVYLNDGTIVNWDEVLQAELPVGTKAEGGVPASQESFDHFLKTRGMPLFRIRHRLSIGDFASLSEMTATTICGISSRTSCVCEVRTLRSLKSKALTPLMRSRPPPPDVSPQLSDAWETLLPIM